MPTCAKWSFNNTSLRQAEGTKSCYVLRHNRPSSTAEISSQMLKRLCWMRNRQLCRIFSQCKRFTYLIILNVFLCIIFYLVHKWGRTQETSIYTEFFTRWCCDGVAPKHICYNIVFARNPMNFKAVWQYFFCNLSNLGLSTSESAFENMPTSGRWSVRTSKEGRPHKKWSHLAMAHWMPTHSNSIVE